MENKINERTTLYKNNVTTQQGYVIKVQIVTNN